jgi:glycosyltransferase involved in cell wall biosynthesis
MKLFYLFQAKLVEKFEKNVICHVTGVFCISDTDKVFIQKQYKVKNIEFVPLGLNFTEETKFSDQLTTKFLFIGKLDWPPNKDGLMWFLDNVWNQLIQLRDDIQLVIVGGGDSAWLKNKLPIKGVDFRGRVEEVQSVYDEIDFALIPIFYGSGTRIKVLEAVSKQKPIISTEMGVMGSNLLSDHFLSAQTQNEWIDCLAKAQLNQEMINMAQKAHAYLEKDFDEKRVSQKLEDFLLSF